MLGGEGGGEAVGVGEFMVGVELGGELGELVVGADQLDGQLDDSIGDDDIRRRAANGAYGRAQHAAPLQRQESAWSGVSVVCVWCESRSVAPTALIAFWLIFPSADALG